MDSFFTKGFKAAKCKTLLKLTIPRIKLLRNRREIQLKQMRKEIAKLLETGQEATARIRVEHIIREEKMMAAQEIVELFCELISVRLPIIEAQRECPIDLKEAISSVCFAAPRCADLPELLQVQMMFAGKYGKEFIAAATELMPECGVNRQLIELLSIRAPAPDVKMKLLKEIAEEHELDWDPSASETELLKSHEDLLNGPTQFVSGAKVPLPKERFDEVQHFSSDQAYDKQTESEADFDSFDFPEVPKQQPVRPSTGGVSSPEMLPFPASALSDFDDDYIAKPSEDGEFKSHKQNVERDEVLQEKVVSKDVGSGDTSSAPEEEKQFLPFMVPPPKSSPFSSTESATTQSTQPPSTTKTKDEINVDLQDVLAAAQAAAESAERAAAAARSAASLAHVRISELTRKRSEEVPVSSSENPFYAEKQEPHIQHQLSNSDGIPSPHGSPLEHQVLNIPSYDDSTVGLESPISSHIHHPGQGTGLHRPQRLPSLDDETYYSYPNLFNATNGSNPSSRSQSFKDNIKSSHDK
ncbi:uncharacterized protein LOC132033800 [Lycium ferocissimum]|uniref:uncharacterized protein LOC132033800 n=1 Tax=Lycium ferocissimum TaxID=112874 RepID=UPI002816834F|nr:uncharacterized protein LOC132033800 [Lycium ferocissimum]